MLSLFHGLSNRPLNPLYIDISKNQKNIASLRVIVVGIAHATSAER